MDDTFDLDKEMIKISECTDRVISEKLNLIADKLMRGGVPKEFQIAQILYEIAKTRQHEKVGDLIAELNEFNIDIEIDFESAEIERKDSLTFKASMPTPTVRIVRVTKETLGEA